MGDWRVLSVYGIIILQANCGLSGIHEAVIQLEAEAAGRGENPDRTGPDRTDRK